VATWAGLTVHVYVLLLEIEFSRGKGWDHINRFNPATFYVIYKRSKCLFWVLWGNNLWVLDNDVWLYLHIGLWIRLWKESLNSDGHQFHQYQQKEQSSFILNSMNTQKKDHDIWQYVDRVKHHYLKLTSYFLRELKINIWTVYKLHSGIYPW
jgi:hypothetical protein